MKVCRDAHGGGHKEGDTRKKKGQHNDTFQGLQTVRFSVAFVGNRETQGKVESTLFNTGRKRDSHAGEIIRMFKTRRGF